MNIAITGGGTGGHLAIARAMKNELKRQGKSCIYIGSSSGQDKLWFEKESDFAATYFLDSKGVVNKKGVKKLITLMGVIKKSFTCKSIFTKHRVDAVFCVGGYSAAPTAIAAVLFQKPLFIHEQNAIMGSLNKLLKPFCKGFYSSYHDDSKIKDYPVAQKFFDLKRERKSIQTIIFLGGSQGASAINNLAMNTAKYLIEKGIHVIHQCGKNDYEKVHAFYSENSLNVEHFAFNTNIIDYLQKADFAISRAGASTLWELSANALPALFIPFPYAAKNHQFYNAKVLVEASAALLYRQEEIDEKKLLYLIDTVDVEKLSKNLSDIIHPSGITAIYKDMEEKI